MNLKKKITIIVVIILIIIIAAIAVIWRIKQSSAEASVRPALITNIVVGKAIRGDIEHIETLTGNVMSDQQASIYSKVNGNIEQIYVDIGDFVKQNQLLALIDTTIYAQNVKQASASYDQTLANVANAKVSYERNK
jgi:multidrug efflux pump subunit AcrA (membrane-fusion protein)